MCYRTGKYPIRRGVRASFSPEILRAGAVKGLIYDNNYNPGKRWVLYPCSAFLGGMTYSAHYGFPPFLFWYYAPSALWMSCPPFLSFKGEPKLGRKLAWKLYKYFHLHCPPRCSNAISIFISKGPFFFFCSSSSSSSSSSCSSASSFFFFLFFFFFFFFFPMYN